MKKRLSAICMSVVLMALIAAALVCDVSVALKIFAVVAGVYGFYELHRWVKK